METVETVALDLACTMPRCMSIVTQAICTSSYMVRNFEAGFIMGTPLWRARTCVGGAMHVNRCAVDCLEWT